MTEEMRQRVATLSENPSLEPIARLAELHYMAAQIAAEAEVVASKLTMITASEEGDPHPATEAWMELCGFYRTKARLFSDSLVRAVEVSGIKELEERLDRFNKDTVDNLAKLYAEDENFRNALDEAAEQRNVK